MNCTKCNTSIPDDKLFCPNCGKLIDNMAEEVFVRKKTSVYNRDKINLLALIGGLLIFISILMPFVEWYWVENGVVFEVTHPYDFFYSTFNDIIYANVRMDMPSMSIMRLIIMLFEDIIASLIFIGGGITAVCAFKKHKRTVLTSAVTGIFGVSYAILRLVGPQDSEAHTSYAFGFYVFAAGTICLLIAAGKAFFDRDTGT